MKDDPIDVIMGYRLKFKLGEEKIGVDDAKAKKIPNYRLDPNLNLPSKYALIDFTKGQA